MASDQPGEIASIANEIDDCARELDRLLDDGIRLLARLQALSDRARPIAQRLEARPKLIAQETDHVEH